VGERSRLVGGRLAAEVEIGRAGMDVGVGPGDRGVCVPHVEQGASDGLAVRGLDGAGEDQGLTGLIGPLPSAGTAYSFTSPAFVSTPT